MSTPAVSPPEPKLLLSVFDVMALTGLSRGKVNAEIAAGRLLSKRVGTRRLIRRDALDAWIDALPDGTPQ